MVKCNANGRRVSIPSAVCPIGGTCGMSHSLQARPQGEERRKAANEYGHASECDPDLA